jgi:hypothetical protein
LVSVSGPYPRQRPGGAVRGDLRQRRPVRGMGEALLHKRDPAQPRERRRPAERRVAKGQRAPRPRHEVLRHKLQGPAAGKYRGPGREDRRAPYQQRKLPGPQPATGPLPRARKVHLHRPAVQHGQRRVPVQRQLSAL